VGATAYYWTGTNRIDLLGPSIGAEAESIYVSDGYIYESGLFIPRMHRKLPHVTGQRALGLTYLSESKDTLHLENVIVGPSETKKA